MWDFEAEVNFNKFLDYLKSKNYQEIDMETLLYKHNIYKGPEKSDMEIEINDEIKMEIEIEEKKNM